MTARARDLPAPLGGYASVFGVRDLAGDVVHAGAFRRTIAGRGAVPLLVRHDTRLRAGLWRELREDRRGLFVRGEIDPDAPGAGLALTLLRAGVDGLSIGFTLVRGRARPEGGRDLLEIALLEISLVVSPMCREARLFNAARVSAYPRKP
jgi:hypothetical protein